MFSAGLWPEGQTKQSSGLGKITTLVLKGLEFRIARCNHRDIKCRLWKDHFRESPLEAPLQGSSQWGNSPMVNPRAKLSCLFGTQTECD
jgi:hypothetical protein